MSAIEEVVSALQSVIDELNDAHSATNTADNEAEDALSQATALGSTNAMSGLEAVRNTIDQLKQQISATIDVANQAISQAKAVADGT